MRMLNPSPGECVDRQTILALKIHHGAALDVPVTKDVMVKETETMGLAKTTMEGAGPVNIEPFLEENEKLQKYLEENYFPDIAKVIGATTKFDLFFNALAETNSQLWKLEDQARALRDAPERFNDEIGLIKRKAEVLDAITSMNDKRAALVSSINQLWGIFQHEKLHQE